MANFPTWIKKTNSSTNNSNLSPRQVANKAYTLAIKKLDRDDKSRRPQYTVRERLLLSNTMSKAEDLLNKRTPRFNRRVLASEDHNEDYAPPAKKMALGPAPAPVQEQPAKKIEPEVVVEKELIIVQEEMKVTPVVAKELPKKIQINESPLPTPEQIAVSIAVVAAAAAYTSLKEHCQQQASLHDFCRPILIPSHSLSSFATII
jgi:hypothetical protein